MIIKLCKRRHRISIVVDSTYHGHQMNKIRFKFKDQG